MKLKSVRTQVRDQVWRQVLDQVYGNFINIDTDIIR
jgi:hypothetical protein